jgi:hypothetical protein
MEIPHSQPQTAKSKSESKLLYDWQFTVNQFVLAPGPLRLTTKNLWSWASRRQVCCCWSSVYSLGTDHTKNTSSNSSCTVAFWFNAAETCLQRLCRKRQHRQHHVPYCCVSIWCRGYVLTVPLPSNDRLYWFHCSDFRLNFLMATQNDAGYWVLAADAMKFANLLCTTMSGTSPKTFHSYDLTQLLSNSKRILAA